MTTHETARAGDHGQGTTIAMVRASGTLGMGGGDCGPGSELYNKDAVRH